jgi:hypothetical protein
MRRAGWNLTLTALVLCLAAAPQLWAADSTQTQWQLSKFTWVKRVPAEAGSPANAHPATLPEGSLQAALAPAQVTVDGELLALFGKDELTALAKALREAFALARPGEDLILLSTSKRGGRFMEEPLALTARLFLREGSLNLLVHDARLSFMGRYQAENILPAFTYGTRAKASAVALQHPEGTRLRGDWLALPLVAAPAGAAPAPLPTPPATAASPLPKPAALAAPAPVAKDPAFYEAQTQRLKALKRMREEQVLSEAEYQEKRDAILKTL